MMLADRTIRKLLDSKELIVDPAPHDSQIQPASLDLALGGDFLSPISQHVDKRSVCYTIAPGECVLACTAERIQIPAFLVGRVEGKSSWGRKFLMVHSTAGFIDPGFEGQITLELKNLSPVKLTLPVGAMIAQISFQLLDVPALRPYGSAGLNSHYQGQQGATVSATPWD